MQIEMNGRLLEMLDRAALFDLVRRERFARDQCLFDVMRDCFHPDAHIRTSWYDAKGADAYVEATRKIMSASRSSKHWVFPAYARIHGDRATVESPATIFDRTKINDIEIDLDVYCRFFSRAVKCEGQWKLMTFEVLFERDIMRAVNPAEQLPVDWSVLATLRPSYRFLAYRLMARGRQVNQSLLGDDRPEQLQAFHDGEVAWLTASS